MIDFVSLSAADWGHSSQTFSASDLIDQLRIQTKAAVENFHFTVLEDDPATHPDYAGFVRVVGIIPVSAEFFDAFFHGPSGYRAQYANSIETGERFNAAVVSAIGDMLLPHEDRYPSGRNADLVAASLRGGHSKVWFPKEMTDPAASSWWHGATSPINWPRWLEYWSQRPEPHKGLFAYTPLEPAILINGTFLHPATHEVWNQKPERSRQLYETGWT